MIPTSQHSTRTAPPRSKRYKHRCFGALVTVLGLHNAFAEDTVTLYCPDPSHISISPQEDTHTYPNAPFHYQTDIPVAWPMFNNHLTLSGQGVSQQLTTFQLATWTDGSLLCWYTGNADSEVIYTVDDITPYVTRCAFPGQDIPHQSECTDAQADPQHCPLTCTLGTPEGRTQHKTRPGGMT